MIKEYLDYLKDNPEGYWFKRKLYGWGWTPARFEGWAVILVYVALILFLALSIDESASLREVVWYHLIPMLVLTLGLIYISYKKGETPRWQWGLKKEQESVPKEEAVFTETDPKQ